MKDFILILDFGSQYTHLIRARLSDIGVASVIEPADYTLEQLKSAHDSVFLKGIILSGGAQSVSNHIISFDQHWLQIGIPILGICYGHQLLAKFFGGKIKRLTPEFGKENLKVTSTSLLFAGVKRKSIVWMSHNDSVVTLPKKFKQIGVSSCSKYAAIEHRSVPIYGIQFHPEVTHTEEGEKVLDNFIKICQIKKIKKWSPADFVFDASQKYKKIVGQNTILVAVSGGVDSMTLVALLRKKFKKKQILAVYVDSGLMPLDTQAEVEKFCKQYDINLLVENHSELFFKKLCSITDPTRKGLIIGRTFIKIFEKIAKRKKIHFFSQGTIWSDVVESGVTKFSSQIKPHHNVGGLPKELPFTLLEPLRELFKDQVRELATFMKLPGAIITKKVFPGPGFAIRVQGEVTKEKVFKVRQCSAIIEEKIFGSSIGKKIWMAFAILITVPSLGVKGDSRVENSEAIVIRIVESKNSLTANFSQLAYPYLEEISNRIVKETGVGRVVYDITNKPPATIEWQ